MKCRYIAFLTFLLLIVYILPVASEVANRESADAVVIFTNPDLEPDKTHKLSIPPEADINEKMSILVSEIEKLRNISESVTLIVSESLSTTTLNALGGAEISISGGTLKHPYMCVTTKFGTCIFVTEPLLENNSPYIISFRKDSFPVIKKEVMLKSGAVVFIPIDPSISDIKKKLVDKAPRMPLDLTDLKKSELRVRAETTKSMIDEPVPEGKEILLDLLRDEEVEVGGNSAAALGTLYVQGYLTIEEIQNIINDKTIAEKVRFSLLREIARISHPEVASLLTHLIKEGDDGERRFCTGLIGYQGWEIAVPLLIELMGDTDEWVRYNANMQLKYITRGQDFGENVEVWKAWWEKVFTNSSSD